MKMNDLISVILPIYNVEQYIQHCIESIVSQTYRNLEIILVDDGSPDCCPQICDDWAKIDQRIRVIHKENGGQASARNCGLDLASGKYISFVDSDDYLAFDFIEKMYHSLKQSKAEVVICSANFVDENGKILNEPQPVMNGIFTGRDMLLNHAKCSWGYYVWPWNKLYRREIFEKLRYEEGVKAEDDRLLHHLFWNIQRVCTIPEKLYYYVQHEGSDSSKTNTFQMRDLDVYDGIIKRLLFYKEYDYDLLQNYNIRMLYSNLAKSLIHCYGSNSYSSTVEKRFINICRQIYEITGQDYSSYVGSKVPTWLLEHKPILYVYYWKAQQLRNRLKEKRK